MRFLTWYDVNCCIIFHMANIKHVVTEKGFRSMNLTHFVQEVWGVIHLIKWAPPWTPPYLKKHNIYIKYSIILQH